MPLSEARARLRHIHPELTRAGWDLTDRSRLRREVPVDGYDAEPWNGVTDYCLYSDNGEVLAIVEAKRATRSPREADAH